MEAKIRITVLGPPGAGKGTQSQKISDFLEIPHISTGDMLRKYKEVGEQGDKVEEYMSKGEHVPDNLVFDILDHRLEKDDASKGFVLDGFPRDLKQAEHLEDVRGIDLALSIEVEEEKVEERLSGRRTCEDCGETYHLKFKPPEKEGVCDICGGELYQREDDRKEVIEERLENYRETTAPVKSFYKELGVLETVDGSKEINEVWESVKKVLEQNLDLEKA